MEKRSRRRTRDLVTQAASQGLSQNEIGYARISMMARSTNAPCKGRIQMRKTNPLHLFTFGLQRTAGPYSWVNFRGGTRVNSRTRTDPYGPNSGIRLPPWVSNGEAARWPRMKDSRFREPVVGQPLDPLPGRPVFLAPLP